jgi:hypothetical protein
MDLYSSNYFGNSGNTPSEQDPGKDVYEEKRKKLVEGQDGSAGHDETTDMEESEVYDNIDDDGYDKRLGSPPKRQSSLTDPSASMGDTQSPKMRNIVPFTVKKRNLFSANSAINCLRFSPDGYQLACGTSGGVARLYCASCHLLTLLGYGQYTIRVRVVQPLWEALQ